MCGENKDLITYWATNVNNSEEPYDSNRVARMDFILANNQWNFFVKSVKAFVGAPCDSDRKGLECDIEIKWLKGRQGKG